MPTKKKVNLYISKEEFLEQFECYKADLEKSNGIRPWEQPRDTKKQIDLASSSGTVAVQKEEER